MAERQCTELEGKENEQCAEEVSRSVGSFINILSDETMREKDRLKD